MTTFPLWAWYGFTALIAALMVLDLMVLGRRTREVSFRSATVQSVFWIVAALLFGAVIFVLAGPERGSEYFTGYIVERSLSVDNVFVFALIFSYFAVPSRYQNRVLFWGILGALVLRGGFIAVGAELLHRYEWMVYVFGIFLIYTGIRMAMHDDAEVHPERNPVLRLVRKLVPMTEDFQNENFFVRHGGKLLATPLFAVIVVVGTTDVVFAVDSIPAIFAVTSSTFIVWSTNAFAVLGLQSLYFMLVGMIERFVYLDLGLAVVLIFVGGKFIYSGAFDAKVPIWVSLPFILLVVLGSILAPLYKTRGQGAQGSAGLGGAGEAGALETDGPPPELRSLGAQRREAAPAALRAANKRQSGEYKRRSHQKNVSEVSGINPAAPTKPRAAKVVATPAAPTLCSRGLLAGQPATRLPPTVSNAATTRQAPADGISSPPITVLASRLSSAVGQDDPRAQFACIAAKKKRTPAPEYFIALATPTFITFPFESSLQSL